MVTILTLAVPQAHSVVLSHVHRMPPTLQEINALQTGSKIIVKPGAHSCFPSLRTGIFTPATVVFGVGKDTHPNRPRGTMTVKSRGIGSRIPIFPDGVKEIIDPVLERDIRAASTCVHPCHALAQPLFESPPVTASR